MIRLLAPVALGLLATGCATAVQPGEYGADGQISAQDSCSNGVRALHVPSPDWSEQVIYMVFIDRFDDADTSNNGGEQGEYKPGSPAHFNGGDIAGVTRRLDYLQQMGVTALWISPPVENQVWSSIYDAAGWHGYWASDFSSIDPHFGTLEDYRNLSRELHCRGMFLIQDIVVNHTGNYFGYDGPYNPEDTSENFVLHEAGTGFADRPTQPPFDKVDRHDPGDAAAAIYNWTPPISDYSDPAQEKTYQLGHLSDINTANPVVRERFKQIYRDWIEGVGIDGFRVDTARYVEQDFWTDFFHGEGGVMEAARDTGRAHFLAFGETFIGSSPMKTEGEDYVASYFGTENEPGFNSMIGFPLYFTALRTFGEGAPTRQLAFRLEAAMKSYPDPYVIPNFIDNHDTARFLSLGNAQGFAQALLMIYTVPGIPTLYQGTEQKLKKARQTMFEGGYGTATDMFDAQSQGYALLAELADLRERHPLFARGDFNVLDSDEARSGVLAYSRSLDDQTAIVLFNTADHSVLAQDIASGLAPGTILQGIGRWAPDEAVTVDAAGTINTVLPPRAAFVLMPSGEALEPPAAPREALIPASDIAGTVQNRDFRFSGTGALPEQDLLLVRDGNYDRALPMIADSNGDWSVKVEVDDLGRNEASVQVVAADGALRSQQLAFTALSNEPQITAMADDPYADDRGPSGNYTGLQQSANAGQKDILAARVEAGGANLVLTLTMRDLTDGWQPANGFDNLMLSVYLDTDTTEGSAILPQIDSLAPDGLRWNMSHIATGWASAMYGYEGADEQDRGSALGVSPRIAVDKGQRSLTITYEGARLGIEDWAGAKIYITTWDHTQEGGYVELREQPGDWHVGGGTAGDAKILDDLLVELPR